MYDARGAAPGRSAAPELEGRWTDVFRSDTLVHACLFFSIAAGFFQGYLKDRMGGAIPYALADAAFIGAAFFWFAGLVIGRRPIEGPGRVPHVILALVALPFLYLLLPGTPLVIQLAGLRGWSAFPVAALIALTVVRSPAHARAYVAWILLLCAVTAVYGIVQYRTGPGAALGVSDLAQERHGFTVFYNVGAGRDSEFRAFSTFTFPAPFAGMMTFGMLLASGVALSRAIAPRLRWLSVALLPLYFAGITVSGTRAALVILIVGLALVARLRRLRWRVVLLAPALVMSVYAGLTLTSGRALDRFASLFTSEGLAWTYVLAPLTTAWHSLQTAPFGLGLGRSGVGVPYRIVDAMPTGFFVGSDGDIARAAVEMGLIGVALLSLIVVYFVPVVLRSARLLLAEGGDVDDLAVGAGALVVSTGVLTLIGSPLTTIPHGLIWWFLVGTVVKLAALRQQTEADERAP